MTTTAEPNAPPPAESPLLARGAATLTQIFAWPMKSLRVSTPLLLLLPAIIVLFATIAAPLAFSFYSSFTAFRLTRPESLWVLIGTRNYVNVFTDPVFWWAFGRTVLLLTVALNLEMLLGLGLALLVERATRGQRFLRTLMMFPMMFSPILVGFQFKFLFNDNVGLVNNALQSLRITETAIPWLIDGRLAFFAIVVAEVWSSTPVFAILILAGLLAMPREPVEAAKVDGCTPWQSFRCVTWPFIMPFAYIAMTIRSLDVGRAYDIVKIMTDGGPARRTELIWTLVARTAYSRYSLWTRNPELGLIQACAETGAIMVAFSPVGRGYFSGLLQEVETFDERDFRHANPRFQGINWRRNRDRLAPYLALARSWGVKPATLAVAWTLAKPPHIVAIPGTRSADHLEECAAAADLALDATRLAELERLLPAGFAAGERYSDQQWVGIQKY